MRSGVAVRGQVEQWRSQQWRSQTSLTNFNSTTCREERGVLCCVCGGDGGGRVFLVVRHH